MSVRHGFRRSAARFGADERGAVFVFVTLLLPVLIGLGALTVDMARLSNLHTALQKGADALALAGAAELDRKPTAITRADNAIATLVANNSKFSTAGRATITVTKRYLTALPGNDATAIPAGGTTDPALARFVEVTVVPRTFNTIFPMSLIGGSDAARTVTARAAAGFNAVVCQFTPMFICNPWETSGTSIYDIVKDPAQRRRQIKMQTKSSGELGPGNYGWLDPDPTLNTGAGVLLDALASIRPKTCFVQNGVSQRPGNIGAADRAINTRFDLWGGGFKSDDPEYRPSVNVRKGYTAPPGNACNSTEQLTKGDKKAVPEVLPANINKLGQDATFTGLLGNGDWDFNLYWSTNFGTPAPNGWSNVNRPSRYEVYRYEIDHGMTGTAAANGPAAGEKGTPACYTGGALSDNPDRRAIYGAVINCQGLSAALKPIAGNSGPPMPVVAFAKFFLTEPVAADGTIYAEISGIVEPGSVSKDVARDVVQLAR